MSERITHTAISRDTVELALRSDSICREMKQVLKDREYLIGLASITKKGDANIPGLLEFIRDHWGKEKDQEKLEALLAYVIGWMGHRAADRQMKPVFRHFDPKGEKSPKDCSIYHDAVIFRSRFLKNYDPLLPSDMFSDLEKKYGDVLKTGDIEDFLLMALQRQLLTLHTFKPDESRPLEWVQELIEVFQPQKIDIQRYVDAIIRPDEELMRKFIVEGNFYHADDPLLACVHEILDGREVSSAKIDAALASEQESHYAQALKTAMNYTIAASDCFKGKIDMAGLKEALLIGKPGVDGLWV